MQNDEISKYISEERTRGVSDKDIKKELLSKGWKEYTIDETMKMSASAPNTSPVISGEAAFIGAADLLAGSWKEMQLHFMPIISIMSLPVVAYVIAELTRSHNDVGMKVIYTVAEIAFAALMLLATIGLIKQIRANWVNPTDETYKVSLPYFWPTVWVSILTGLAVMGGLLLFIVPGIILMIMLSFSRIAVVLEEQRGLTAIMWSKVLVRGMWWEVFFRMIILGIVMLIVSIVLSILPFVGGVLSLLTVPFSMIYTVRLYDALKAHKEVTPITVSKEGSGYIIAAMIAGVVAIPLFLIMLGGLLVFSHVNNNGLPLNNPAGTVETGTPLDPEDIGI